MRVGNARMLVEIMDVACSQKNVIFRIIYLATVIITSREIISELIPRTKLTCLSYPFDEYIASLFKPSLIVSNMLTVV